MLSRVLAFRPASVLERLPPRSDACPLSLRDVLWAAGRGKLPAVEATGPGVIRAALVAAKVLRSTIGLAIPSGVAPEAWFETVAAIADEIAAALPFFSSALVALEGESALSVERGTREVWRLVEAGMTHVAVDASAVSPEERGRILAQVSSPLQERGLGFDCIVPLGEPGAGRRAIALVEELARRGAPADAVSVVCPAPPDLEAARAQLGALDRLAEVLGEVAVFRRGAISKALLAEVGGSRLRGCEDGGAAALRVGLPAEEGKGSAREAERRARWRSRVVAVLGEEEAERLEARAFVTAAEFIEALGAEHSASAVARALELRLAGDGP
ncbi:MAG TPA: hypothetical protein VFG53_12000 [Anaeromyxobacter sp.]|nr:hypothetical protein [Anaeromyxobacter sp.]